MTGAGIVFWDFDATLAKRAQMWRGCLVTALTEVCPGHNVTAESIRPGLQDGFPWHSPTLPHLQLDTPTRWWNAVRPVFLYAYERAGVDHATALAAADLVPQVYVDPRYWSVFDDVQPALTRLREAGWHHIVVSNHVPELPELVSALGLAGLFDDIITSAATGYEKPHPQMFAIALEVARYPEISWMVGDNPVADVSGAQRAGIRGLLVRHTPRGRELHQAADVILDACSDTSYPTRRSAE